MEETIDLDEGESACIQIAINHDDVLLIMDERAGRAHALEKEASFIYRFTVCHLDEGEILVLRALRSLVVRTSPPSG